MHNITVSSVLHRLNISSHLSIYLSKPMELTLSCFRPCDVTIPLTVSGEVLLRIPSHRTWRSWWGQTGPTGRASCCTFPRFTSTLRPEKWQRPGGGGPQLCPETLQCLSFTSRRHGRRSPDGLTFDPYVDFLTQSEVPKKAVCGSTCRGACETVKAGLRWTHQAALLLSQAYVASCMKQVWLLVSFAETSLLCINHSLFKRNFHRTSWCFAFGG